MRSIVSFLITFSALSRVVAGASNEDLDVTPCRARAWVRAPDLEVGRVVQGDVKVKLDGACEEVLSYTLGLRFAERSWVKTRRDGVTLPVSPDEDQGQARRVPKEPSNDSDIYDSTSHVGWNHWAYPGFNQSAWEKYESDMKNPALWLVREEERIAFETRYDLFDADTKPGPEIVKSFALLVPSTIYPPAFDMTHLDCLLYELNVAHAEHIYLYFVDVNFHNGTHREIEAGYTSFDSALDPISRTADGIGRLGSFDSAIAAPHVPESVNVTAARTSIRKWNTGSSTRADDTTSLDEFTLEVTFPDGRHLEQGSTNNITIVSHQLGPGLQRPLEIEYMSVSARQKRPWAAQFAADSETAEELLQDGYIYESELRSTRTADDRWNPSLDYPQESDLAQFSQSGVIEKDTIFSTDSVVARLKVPLDTYPSFHMYYQRSEVELKILMTVPDTSSNYPPELDTLDDEEYDWTPDVREPQRSYLDTEILEARIPISVYRKPEHHTTRASRVVHYLSPKARAPTFVDPSSLARLLELSMEERDDLAPFSKPKLTARENEHVVKRRYYGDGECIAMRDGLYYVGNTWLRKVLARGENKDGAHSRILVAQVP